jgi:hypothetical protein
MPFDYTSGNPDNLVGGVPARMQDIQGPFYDLRAYLNSLPSGGGDGGGGGVTVSGQVSEVGQPNQLRAGRQLAASDFTALGLSAPRGLWNLSDLTDASGNARALTNKGGVPFAVGINGNAATAAQFIGSTGQALYIADTGAADPFRITTGSWGCWFRTAKRGVSQDLIAKRSPQLGYVLYIATSNALATFISIDGTSVAVNMPGVSDVADDRWHFGVVTFDGATLRVYVDGVLEATGNASGALFGASGPLNIGAYGADGATAATEPHYGRVDEAFVSADVLSDDQVRLLYAARLTHTLGATPKTVTLNVRRARKGAALAATDFLTAPLRLYNFTAGVWTDQGSNNVSVAPAGGGAAYQAIGADGVQGGSYWITATGWMATDAGLPTALLARSYGCWFKTIATAATGTIMSWGGATADNLNSNAGGTLIAWNGGDSISGPFIADGQWHSAVIVEDNAAADGVKRKLYLDGRLVGGSTVLNSIVAGGANRFRIGSFADGTSPFTGQIDTAFVTGYAMSTDEVLRLYAKGAQPLVASPKNAGDHVEGFDSGSLLFIGDTLESQHSIDLTVS